MRNYYDFFDTMLGTENLPNINFQEAIKKLNEHDEIKYHFYNSEQIFDRVMDDYNKNLFDNEITERRIQDLMEEAYKNDAVKKIPKEIIRRQIQFLLFDQNEVNQAAFKKRFLMIS